MTQATIKTRTLDSIDQGTHEKDVEGQIQGFQVVDGEPEVQNSGLENLVHSGEMTDSILVLL